MESMSCHQTIKEEMSCKAARKNQNIKMKFNKKKKKRNRKKKQDYDGIALGRRKEDYAGVQVSAQRAIIRIFWIGGKNDRGKRRSM